MKTIDRSRVCVIGGAGFLGSHLVNYLIESRKCTVLVLDNLISGLRKNGEGAPPEFPVHLQKGRK